VIKNCQTKKKRSRFAGGGEGKGKGEHRVKKDKSFRPPWVSESKGGKKEEKP